MNLKCPFLSFFTFFSNTNSYILFSLFILAFFLFFSFCWDITIYLINVICILESVFTSIFSPLELTLVFYENLIIVYTLIPKSNLTRPCFRAHLLDWIEILLRVFLCLILTYEQFFHSSLKSEFFMQHWHLDTISFKILQFRKYEMIKQIAKEKVNQRWFPKD